MLKKQEINKYPLRSIYFYLSEGCNLRCCHCWMGAIPKSKKSSLGFLDFALLRSIVRQAKPLGLLGVKLSGGEPLSHPDIENILRFIQNENLQLTVETNATLCTRRIAAEIAKSRTRFVAVSLDGKDAATHDKIRGVKGSFESAKKGICNLVALGVKPQIIMSVMRTNKAQIEEVLHLAESLGASSFKLNMIQPCSRGKELHKRGEALSINSLVSLGEWIEKKLSASTNLSVVYSHPPAFWPLKKIFRSGRGFAPTCGILGILGVLANGAYALCGIGETIPELIFGNAKTDKLKDVWDNTPLLQELREGLPYRLEGPCGDCVMRGPICPGYCIAQNYNTGKSIWAPYWYCEETYKRGLFPKHRLISHISPAIK